jgi:hypothetical protein
MCQNLRVLEFQHSKKHRKYPTANTLCEGLITNLRKENLHTFIEAFVGATATETFIIKFENTFLPLVVFMGIAWYTVI